MVEFGAAAELSVTLAPGEAAAVRQELEDEFSDIAIGTGGAAGAFGASGGAAGGSALTDGGLDTLVSLQQEQVDLTEDLLDEIEGGALGGGGGDGGPTIIPFGGGKKAAAAASAVSTIGASVLAPGLAAGVVDDFFQGINPGGITAGDVFGQVGATSVAAGRGTTTPGGDGNKSFSPAQAPFILAEAAANRIGDGTSPLRINNPDQLPAYVRRRFNFGTGAGDGSASEPQWLTEMDTILDQSPEQPGWLTEMDTILQQSPEKPDWLAQMGQIMNPQPTSTSESTADADVNPGSGGTLQAGTDPSTSNTAKENRQQRQRGQTEVNVTQEFQLGQRELERALEEAKRKAVREIENRFKRVGAGRSR